MLCEARSPKIIIYFRINIRIIGPVFRFDPYFIMILLHNYLWTLAGFQTQLLFSASAKMIFLIITNIKCNNTAYDKI